ncbi:hypothetical protein C8A03DRAFT_32397 [Achaetomium macrosporum]|uniref:Protein kinase domain-containing protein n=1 Tax=Achaetomium macrosporum TaxID=79813 RepID=A0AAN7HDE6_9PEZI|nr:hypothetical protein C8A03DRAFT_32397 [Achaetomium macrosporum]
MVSGLYYFPTALASDLFWTRAIVKTDTPDRWKWLKREFNAYPYPSIKKSPHIRSMYDWINDYKTPASFGHQDAFEAAAEKEPFCLVLEWLDEPLSKLDPAIYRHNPAFMAALFEGMLGGVKDIGTAGLIWTAGEDGYNKADLQPLAMRAPEVFNGWGCFHTSNVWSIGTTVLCWLKQYILGPHDNKLGSLFDEAWCMAKIIRLFEKYKGTMPGPPEDAKRVKKTIHKLAYDLLTQPDDGDEYSMHVPARPFDEVVPKLDISPEVEAMLRRFFVLDHNARPTAQELLQSFEFCKLKAAAQLSAQKLSSEESSRYLS